MTTHSTTDTATGAPEATDAGTALAALRAVADDLLPQPVGELGDRDDLRPA